MSERPLRGPRTGGAPRGAPPAFALREQHSSAILTGAALAGLALLAADVAAVVDGAATAIVATPLRGVRAAITAHSPLPPQRPWFHPGGNSPPGNTRRDRRFPPHNKWTGWPGNGRSPVPHWPAPPTGDAGCQLYSRPTAIAAVVSETNRYGDGSGDDLAVRDAARMRQCVRVARGHAPLEDSSPGERNTCWNRADAPRTVQAPNVRRCPGWRGHRRQVIRWP